MKKIIFAVFIALFMAATANAAERNTLVSGNGQELGTQSNPIKVSLIGGGGGGGDGAFTDAGSIVELTPSGSTDDVYLYASQDMSISDNLTVGALFLQDGTQITGSGGSSEWSDDGTTLTTADANREVEVGAADFLVDTNALFVDASENSVGIGTASPDVELDVIGQLQVEGTSGSPSTANSLMSLENTSTNIGFQMGADNDEGWIRSADIGVAFLTYGNIRLGSNFLTLGDGDDTNQFYLNTSSKRFGLGTTSPASKLDIEGNVAIGSTYSGSTAAPTNGLIVEGNVGIGTNSPQVALDVSGDASIDGNLTATAIYLEDGTVIDGQQSSIWQRTTVAGDNVLSPVNTADSVKINADLTIEGTLYATELGYGDQNLQGNLTVGDKLWASPVQYTFSGNKTLASNEVTGSIVYVTGAGTITLPAVADGDSTQIETVGNIAVAVDPNASDKLYLNGIALDDGDKAWNLTTSGNIFNLRSYPPVSPDGWMLICDGCVDGGV